jgi:hypothetical protein
MSNIEKKTDNNIDINNNDGIFNKLTNSLSTLMPSTLMPSTLKTQPNSSPNFIISNKKTNNKLSSIMSDSAVTLDTIKSSPSLKSTNALTEKDILGSTTSLSSSTPKTSFFNWTNILLIILILAFLGINIFTYLSKGTKLFGEGVIQSIDVIGQGTTFLEKITQTFNKILASIIKLFGLITLTTTSKVIDTTTNVTTSGIDLVSNVTTSSIDAASNLLTDPIDNITNKAKKTSSKSNQMSIEETDTTTKQSNVVQNDSLNKALTSTDSVVNNTEYDSTNVLSNIKKGKEQGWCYIGLDRGFRSCSEVGVHDTCMSGSIFPSRELCMNPRLRA